MVGGDGPNDFRPTHLAAAALLNPVADGLEHHVARMEHVALVAVIQGKGAKGPLHNHLAQSHRACLQGNVGDPMHGHARGHFEPEAGIARDR